MQARGETRIGGYDELARLDCAGELDQMLVAAVAGAPLASPTRAGWFS